MILGAQWAFGSDYPPTQSSRCCSLLLLLGETRRWSLSINTMIIFSISTIVDLLTNVAACIICLGHWEDGSCSQSAICHSCNPRPICTWRSFHLFFCGCLKILALKNIHRLNSYISRYIMIALIIFVEISMSLD